MHYSKKHQEHDEEKNTHKKMENLKRHSPQLYTLTKKQGGGKAKKRRSTTNASRGKSKKKLKETPFINAILH
jgi:hypothetical protein